MMLPLIQPGSTRTLLLDSLLSYGGDSSSSKESAVLLDKTERELQKVRKDSKRNKDCMNKTNPVTWLFALYNFLDIHVSS